MTTTEPLKTVSKWDILPQDHPLVIKRLARELNANGWQAGRAFYGNGKFNRARVSHGKLQVTMCSDPWQDADPSTPFEDSGANQIYASRTRCGH